MRVNPRPAHVRPYIPSLYLPGSLGRFRQYPRVTTTPIPGAGHNARKGVWGEQVLYLGGYGDLFKTDGPYPYGQYGRVPLRGLGQVLTPWYARTWVWGVAGGAALLLGVGSYMALRKNASARKKKPRSGRVSESRKYPRSDWAYEVRNGDTRLGYAEWLEHKRESDRYDRKRK